MLAIENKQIDNFLNKLSKKYEIQDIQNNPLSFKKYFLPAKEIMFQKDNLNGKIKIAQPPKKFILFGLNSEDLNALTYLDKIMSFPKKDFFYFRNRKQSIVIAIIKNETAADCRGGDIIFKKQNDFYTVAINTKNGERLISQNKEFFIETQELPEKSAITTPPENTFLKSENIWTKEINELILDSELLKNAVEWSHKSKIWDELALICLGCGICTYVCPLCFCFETEDTVKLDGKCEKCRKWNACTLPSFSQISGGHNFHPTIKERYYNWFYHKFVRGYLEYGESQCVGCERCKKYCPAKIDILEVLKRIIKEYQEIKN